MIEKSSIIKVLEIPNEFGAILLVFTLILGVSPYLAGHDFGIFKIPNFSESARKRLKIIGPLAFVVVVLCFIPLFDPTPVIPLSVTIRTPTSTTLPVEVDNGAGKIVVTGTSSGIHGTKYKIYLVAHTFAPRDDKVWWFDETKNPITPKSNDEWSGVAWTGSSDYPITNNQGGNKVEIQAIVATEEELQRELNSHKDNPGTYIIDPRKFPIRSEPVSLIAVPK